jgi:uncharacterized sulfatase
MSKIKKVLSAYLNISFSLLSVFFLFRIYEYFTAGIKLILNESLLIVISKCLLFDTLTWLIYCGILFFPFFLIYLIHRKAAVIFLHTLNIITIFIFFGLLVVFLERLIPFDHEFFVRSFRDTFSTSMNEVTGRFLLVFPLFIYLLIYCILNLWVFHKKAWDKYVLGIFGLSMVFSVLFIQYSKPKTPNYRQIQSYYLVNNKLHYFLFDSYFFLQRKANLKIQSKEEIQKTVNEYQSLNHFSFVDPEYPFLHIDESKNVLKDFFRKNDTVPNIVIIIFEGLSRDFSGDDAMAGSFTPFLDSLSRKSLSWYNCLSNGQGTFGSLPSIIGSLPFGDRGFTLLSQPPEHISLVKILKKNNWGAYYFAGGEINFDNFGGFMRLQGVDYISSKFSPKYKMMGVDKEGMSAGYPDDALFNYSFEVLNSIKHEPYISVYLTLTTHTPFIFDQSAQYRKIYEKEIKRRNLSNAQKRDLRNYRDLWISCLFSDNCLRNFFNEYKNKKEFKNTIFVITGDHHHGYYPTRNEIDDFNVPLIIYSPLLTKAVRFNSVNSHLNIAPTILALLKDNYHLKYYPRYVSWLGDVLDTCRTFRNIHHTPFMLTNRDINDYLYEDNYIGGKQLYQICPQMNLKELPDGELTSKLMKIRDNFKIVNNYVCQNNKLYPATENIYDSAPVEIETFSNDKLQDSKRSGENSALCSDFTPPSQFKKIMVRVSFLIDSDTSQIGGPPIFSTSILSPDKKKELVNSTKNIWELMVPSKTDKGWWTYTDEDIYDLEKIPDKGNHLFHIEVRNSHKIKIKIKELKINFLGID